VIPSHPHVEGVMQEEVGQKRTDYSLNAKDNLPPWRRRGVVLW
jgi:hypothetical protein